MEAEVEVGVEAQPLLRQPAGDVLASVEVGAEQVPVDRQGGGVGELAEDLRTGWCIPPRLGAETIDENYRGFQLIEAGAYFYAVPADEGPFRNDRFNARRYSVMLVSDEWDQLLRYVDEQAVDAARH